MFNQACTDAQSGQLGILQNLRPPYSGAASSDSDFHVIHSTGEIYYPSSDSRVLRYVRQSAARSLLPDSRVSWCLRRLKESSNQSAGVDVLLDNVNNSAHYGGLISCGKPWECPVCASKISQRRRDELCLAVDQHQQNGGRVVLVTYTFSHSFKDDLTDTMKRLQKAFDGMKAQRAFKALKASVGCVGTVRALEITYGKNGWHPHIHEIWFLDKSDFSMQDMKLLIFNVWESQCQKKGLGVPDLEHGIDVSDGSYAATYASKWGIEDELTKANLKKARVVSSRTPFQLLDSYIDGDKQSGALFIEYVKVFRGKRQLCWSRGLRAMFDLKPELTDEELASLQLHSADILGTIELKDWKLVLKNRGKRRDSRAELLRIAESGGWSAVLDFIESLKKSPPVSVRRVIERTPQGGFF